MYKKELKQLLQVIKVPQTFYTQNLYKLIDNHMIILSQVDNAINKKKLDTNHINIISIEDMKIMRDIALYDKETYNYIVNLVKIQSILNAINKNEIISNKSND